MIVYVQMLYFNRIDVSEKNVLSRIKMGKETLYINFSSMRFLFFKKI